MKRKTVTLFLLYICTLTINNLYAQSLVKGKVISPGGTGVSYATIMLLKDTLETGIAVSDSAGFFQFTITDEQLRSDSAYSIRGFYLKLSTQKVRLNRDNPFITLILEDNARFLQDVLVTAENPVFTRKADRFVFLPGKALAEGSSALEIMRHTPLVRYSERSETFSIINRTGTVVYINNKKTEIPRDMLMQMLQAMPAENIKSIEIITNPGSEYASNITGGIININIKRQPYEGWMGNLALQTQQSVYNTTMLNGGVNYRKGKIALQIIPFINNSFNYRTSDNTLTYTDGVQNLLHTRYYRRYLVLGGGLNIDYDIDKNNYLSYSGWLSHVSGTSQTGTNTTFYNAGSSQADSGFFSPSNGDDLYIYNYGSINYRHIINEKKAVTLDCIVDYNQFSQTRKYDGVFNETTQSGKYRNDLPQNFFNLSEKIEYSYPFIKNGKVNIGAQFSNTNVKNDLHYYDWNQSDYVLNTSLSNNYRYTEQYWGGFISTTKSFGEKWNSSLGLRVENTNYSTEVRSLKSKNDSTYLNLFPNFSVSYSPNKKNQFSISYSRKISRPNIELLFPGRTWQNRNFFTENNPFLQPMIYNNAEFSYTFNSRYIFLLSYYQTKNSYSRFVIPVEEDNTLKFKNTYLNYGNINSLDLTLNLNQPLWNHFWEIYFSPTLSYASYKSTSPLVNADITNYNYSLFWDNYVFLSRKKQWTAFLTFKYNSSSKDISGETINATSSLDLMIKKVVRKFSLYLMVNDLYNGSSIYKNHLYANSLLAENFTRTNYYNRSVSLKVRYIFGNKQLKGNRNKGAANDEIRRRASN
ncbi:hypothetical protein A4D02_17265 [Niastella koreensis]|uniref:TonB-dependent receptor plug n=2 Tax=Niastella koreensis TaxID=354356 RepID=G8TE47_NIAKG|nr:outer membrane beta-barrel family protein [Niastella koreensis]AEV97238.1 TonB-dependent receptor plug [Niastella koreensis GR20-10]OQP39085.1 hypothetical protein A4D02_17265 [Niastella koreensis]